MQRTDSRLQDVDENKQSDPDRIHEVPIPSGPLEAEVVIRLEMPAQASHQNHSQRNCTDGDVETMESCQHKESRAIHP